MQIDVLITAIAAATCFQYSLFFLMLWRKHRDPEQEPLRTFSVFAAGLGVMLTGALAMQHVGGPYQAALGLGWYRIQFAGICVTVATLIRFSAQISNHPLPPLFARKRLWVLTIVLAGLAWTPLVLHLPPPGTPRGDYDDRDRGSGFIPYVLLFVAGACYAVTILWRGARVQRRLTAQRSQPGSPYFGDLRLFLIGVLLFLPSGLYEIALALDWLNDTGNLPIPRSLSAIVMCGLTAQLLVNGIIENDRRKQEAETRSRAYLHAMSYATHQVRGNVDNILWQLRAGLKTLQQRDAPRLEQQGIQGAMEEASELLATFNSLLLAARDAAGQALNLGPRRSGDLAGYLEPLCRKRLAMACKAKGWNGSDDPPYPLRFASEVTQPLLFSRDALQHLFAILIDNAVKYSEEGSAIDIEIRQVKDQAEIRVRDHGIGITAGLEEAIFAPFGRGDAAERSPNLPGNGIGLHLARRLAESQGGTLRAQSDGPGCGSTFVLTLPIETEE
jgi:signal transduction histidine kinase